MEVVEFRDYSEKVHFFWKRGSETDILPPLKAIHMCLLKPCFFLWRRWKRCRKRCPIRGFKQASSHGFLRGKGCPKQTPKLKQTPKFKRLTPGLPSIGEVDHHHPDHPAGDIPHTLTHSLTQIRVIRVITTLIILTTLITLIWESHSWHPKTKTHQVYM